MRKLSFFFMALFSFIFFVACEKDNFGTQQGIQEIQAGQEKMHYSSGGTMTINRAKSIFYSIGQSSEADINSFRDSDYDILKDECQSLMPIWYLAKEVNTIDGGTIIIVPIDIADDQTEDGLGAQLVFYESMECDVPIELMFYLTEEPNDQRIENINNCDFTGILAVYNLCDCSQEIYAFKDGIATDEGLIDPTADIGFLGECDSGSLQLRDENPLSLWEQFLDWLVNRCPDVTGGKSTWQKFKEWLHLWRITHKTGSGSSGYEWAAWSGWKNKPLGGLPFYYTPGLLPPGGGDKAIKNIFDSDIMNGEGKIVIDHLERIIDEHNLFICTKALHELLYPCLEEKAEGDEDLYVCIHPELGENSSTYNIDMYIRDLYRIDYTNQCLFDIIEAYQEVQLDIDQGDGNLICFIEENNNFDMEDEEIFEEIKDKCGTDEICQIDVFDCLGRLEEFQNTYEMTLNAEIINALVFDDETGICGMSDTEFEEEVAGKLVLELISDFPDLLDILSALDILFLRENPSAIKAIRDFKNENHEDVLLENECIDDILDIVINGHLEGPYSSDEKDSILELYGFDDVETNYPEYLTWCIIFRTQWENEHPDQECGIGCQISIALQAMWKTKANELHTVFDICGLMFEPCDLINGVIYTIEGDGVNAIISFAAVVPVIGTVAIGSKYKVAYKVANQTFELPISVLDEFYDFGYHGKLASLLKPKPNEQCHHIITWASRKHDIVQLAARKGWHPSHVKNGINLDKSIHSGWDAAHAVYSSNLTIYLDDLAETITDPAIAKAELESLQNSIRSQLEAGKLLDEITFP